MPAVRVDEGSTLARLAAWRSHRTARPLAAVRVENADPWYFVADEVVVDAAEERVVDDLMRRGGRLIEDPPLPPVPEGMERRRHVDMASAPRQAVIRFEELPEADLAVLGEALDHAGERGEHLFSSELGSRVAAAIAPHQAEGRRVGLNLVGRPFQMPLSNPVEGANLAYGADPTAWTAFAGSTRMVQAWQLVDSVRQLRGGPPVWIAVCDSGFWLDGSGAPVVAPGQPASDFGAGVLQWNLVNEGQPVPGGTTSFHGNQVASAALAAVGNAAGAAGAGGTVAVPAFFHTSMAESEALRAVRLCVWWGIDIINFSWGFWGQSEFWFDTDTWDDTFDWAGDNDLVMVAAAGNFGWDLPGGTDHNIRPATRTPRVLTVGWLDPDDTPDRKSDYGSSVNLWAPGLQIEVAPDGGALGGSRVDGTSFSSPIVAGVAAMMRFCNPSLRADDVRRILVDTGWTGSGHVTRGLDAFAAVWSALNFQLPDSNEPNGTVNNPAPLLPVASGSGLAPGFGAFTAIAKASDWDYWSFSVNALSSVTVTVDWYQRLASLNVSVQNVDPAAGDPDLARSGSGASGRLVLSGLLSKGSYRVRVGGSGPTAYRLLVKVSGTTLAPDMFEPNDSFDTATRMAFLARRPWMRTLVPEWGPGRFDATLHRPRTPLGWFYVNSDYYRLDVPARAIFSVPSFTVSDTDEPVDVVLYDAAQDELRRWSGVREVSIEPPDSSVCFVVISGAKQTRYAIDVGMKVKKGILPGPWQEELPFVHKWWGDPPPVWIDERETYYAIEVGQEELADGAIAFTAPSGEVLPKSVQLDLLDGAGEPLRAAVAGDDRAHVIDIEGLEPGTYVLRSAARDASETSAGAIAITPAPPPLR